MAMDASTDPDATEHATLREAPAPFTAQYDWEAAFRIYCEEGITLKAVSERIGASYDTVRDRAAHEKWSLRRQIEKEDIADVWQLKIKDRYMKAADQLKRFDPESIDDLAKLEAACKTHVEAGMKLFGISEKPDSGPSALVQVNVSTGHAADTGSTLRSRAAQHAKQAKPAPPTQDSTAVPPASDPSKA
jgi:hypothetical protein